MPTNRTRTTRGRRAPPIDADAWAFLNDGVPRNPFTRFLPDAYWSGLWADHGERITAEWAVRHPGTRPQHWWKFSAPRAPTPDGLQARDSWLWIEPRCQIRGKPVECDGGASASEKAVPEWDRDDAGHHAAPPVWETEFDYLKRHGLLLPGEAKRVR